MGSLRNFFSFVQVAGYVGQLFLAGYIEFAFIQRDPIQILNPMLHIGVALTMLQAPLFWIFLAASVFGGFAAAGAQAIGDEEGQRTLGGVADDVGRSRIGHEPVKYVHNEAEDEWRRQREHQARL